MSTLFIAPGACSLGAHVVVRELDLPVAVVKVPLRKPESPIFKVNPLGKVPTLLLDDGVAITENTAILPFLADLRPGTPLFAPAGHAERGLIQSWLGYLSAEVHAGTFRLVTRPEKFSDDVSAHAGIKAKALQQLVAAYGHFDRSLEGRDFLVGNRFTIADAYLGVFARWTAKVGDRLAEFRNVERFRVAYEARASVQAALAAEAQTESAPAQVHAASAA